MRMAVSFPCWNPQTRLNDRFGLECHRNFLRAAPSTPINPVPSRSRVPGSGTIAVAVPWTVTLGPSEGGPTEKAMVIGGENALRSAVTALTVFNWRLEMILLTNPDGYVAG